MDKIIPLDVYLTYTIMNELPCIQMKRSTTNPELMKAILSAAFREKPIIIQPMFRNKIQSLATLTSKGIIAYDQEQEQYVFII